MVSSVQSFENLLKLIENTNDKYKTFLTSVNKKQQPGALTKREIEKEILKSQQEYDTIVLNNVKIISNNNNIVSLNYNINDIKQIIENKFITIKTDKYNDEFVQKFANVKFYESKNDPAYYTICQFDLKHTKLSDGSTIDCENKHIKIGSKNYTHCYGMILGDKNNVKGYTSGQHCFRMYYKNPYGAHCYLLFGIYQCGIVPKNMRTAWHETSWGIADNTEGLIYCNGEVEWDESNMSFLYSSDENEIDMLIDFDNGILSYSIVDDKVENRKYIFKKQFNTSISYTVNIGFYHSKTEVQIAKINVEMFGKNKKMVKWPIEKY